MENVVLASFEAMAPHLGGGSRHHRSCEVAKIMERCPRVTGIWAGSRWNRGGFDDLGTMYFGQFLVGMSATAVIVAVWTYMATGSFWEAFGWTIVTLLVVQVGYFVLVVRLIFGRAHHAATSQDPADAVSPLHRDGVWF